MKNKLYPNVLLGDNSRQSANDNGQTETDNDADDIELEKENTKQTGEKKNT